MRIRNMKTDIRRFDPYEVRWICAWSLIYRILLVMGVFMPELIGLVMETDRKRRDDRNVRL